jgi:adenylosuccinate synthase
MPWHVWEDQAGEQEAGEESLGTTLRGIGPCYRDKVGRRHAFRLGDLLHENTWERMRRVAEIKCRWRDSLAAANRPMVDAEAIDPAAVVGEYREYAARLRPLIVDTTALLLDAVERDQSILLEGAQGALLDVDHGTYPFVTSSNSSGVGVSAGSGVPGRWISKVVGVAKCYSTRVGAGPLPTELTDETGEQIRQRGREYGTTTGRPRRCGWFDAVAVRYAARLSGVDTLALMMLDVLSGLPEIRAAVRYELRGREIDSFPSHIEDLSRVRPVYETWPGWQCDISGARSFEDLPREAAAYVTRISYWIGRPVEYISVGPERRQTIVCDQRALLAC